MIESTVALFLSTIFLIYVGNCQSCLLQNCVSCASPYSCLECPAPLRCCQSQCTNCTSQSQCVSCMQNYVLDTANNLCQLAYSCQQVGCVECVAGQCSLCASGYVLDPYTYECRKCPQSCALCTIDGSCLQCQLEYFLEDGSCVNCEQPYCSRCVNQYICLECLNGLTLQNMLPACMSCPNHCSYCSTPGTCEVCLPGYYLRPTSTCGSCSSSCSTCWGSSTNCTTCNPNSYFLNGECVDCFATIPFCVACLMVNNQPSCLNCTRSMYVNNNTCVRCPTGCSTCVSDSNCMSCTNGYFLQSNSICAKCEISNCVSCTNTSYCKSCFLFYSTSPDFSSCIACPPNCNQCTLQSQGQIVCNKCAPGFKIDYGGCVPCQPNCQKCSGQFFSRCTGCLTGFYIVNDYTQNSCVPCPVYCASCDNQILCLSCSPGGYYLFRGLCLPGGSPNCYLLENGNNTSCSICSPAYVVSAGVCLPCPANCSICNSPSICQVCSDGYFIQNGLCSQCPANCLQCSSPGNCTLCAVGFYSSSGPNLCIACPFGCSSCVSSAKCVSCVSGFYLSTYAQPSSICLKCVQPCLMCSSLTACTLCSPGYGINRSGICQPCPNGCLLCDYRQNCEQCETGYALIISPTNNRSLICGACSPGCTKCTSLIHRQTKTVSIICEECAYGLMLLFNNQCFRCGSTQSTAGCQTCDGVGQCIVCLDGFNMTSTGCINSNYQTVKQENWPLVGASIGLGCLAMILLITMLYLRLKNPSAPSGYATQD